MADFSLIRKNFPGQNPNPATTNETISAYQFVRAMKTVGAASLPDFAGWPKHYRDYLRLNANAIAKITHLGSGNLVIMPGIDILDRTEKAQIRFWIGVAIAKLMAERYLHIRWLIWTDRIGTASAPPHVTITKAATSAGKTTKLSPDFIGEDRLGDWHVIEAKGGSRILSKKKHQNAKNQINSILTINRNAPTTRSVCSTVVYAGRTETTWDDPPLERNYLERRIEFTDKQFFESYYAGIRAVLREAEQASMLVRSKINEHEYVFAPLLPHLSEYWIGLLSPLFENPELARRECTDLPFDNEIHDKINSFFASIGPDGIVVMSGHPRDIG